MIQNLLDATRIRAGKGIPIEFTQFDLKELVGDVVEDLRMIYGDRFDFLSDTAIFGEWSSGGIRRVLENLATNAIKYGSPEQPITIRLERRNSMAVLSVHNEGSPIPAEEIPKLFETYHRVSETGRKQGWGLGLTVIQGIVNAHHGSIDVRSEEGRGTTFFVNLPISVGANSRGQIGLVS